MDKYVHLSSNQTVALPSIWSWGNPEPGTFQEYVYSTQLPENDMLISRFEQDDRDRLLGFAVMHVTQGQKGKEQVARIDTRHNEVHMHQFGRGNKELDRRVLRIIQEQQDVENGYDEALDVITANWEEHKRRWAA